MAGDGTAQGTCASATDLCTAAGECLGKYNHYINISTIIIIIIIINSLFFAIYNQ